jgi:uncharacterized membrane protein YeaQ/YmgE (transglycosylase-associated protein family)
MKAFYTTVKYQLTSRRGLPLEFGPAEVGLIVFGILVGWLLAYTMRRHGMGWWHFFAVVVFLGGGAVGSYSLYVVFEMSSFGYFWIGVFVGFFANLIVRQVAERMGWKGIVQLARYR